MSNKPSQRQRLHDGQLALWALELIYPNPPQQRGNVARGSGAAAIQADGTVCIEGSDVQLTHEMEQGLLPSALNAVHEGVYEVVEKDPHVIGPLLDNRLPSGWNK